MAQQRVILGQIDVNSHRRNKELTPSDRGRSYGLFEAGLSISNIAARTGFAKSTIHDTYTKFPQRDKGLTLPRLGHPVAHSIQDERAIMRIIKRDPKITYSALQREAGLTLHRSTMRRIIKAHGYHNWRAKERPYLTEEQAKRRFEWAQEHRNWTLDDWKKVIWSDECSVERGSGKQRVWCFRTAAQKWDKNMIEPVKTSQETKVMVWASCWYDGFSDLVPMVRDGESTAKGYSAASYIAVLDEVLPQIYSPGLIFMQDNARVHTAGVTKNWLEIHGIEVMEWPPYSPDLNPIEHL